MLPYVRPFSYEKTRGKYKFVLTSELSIYFPGVIFGQHEYCDPKGLVWLKTSGSECIIPAGFAWDGASLVPDFASTIAASCWHDVTGQFRHDPCLASTLPWSAWNRIFADIIRSQKSPKVAAVYHFGLILGNKPYQLIGRLFGYRPSGHCRLHAS